MADSIEELRVNSNREIAPELRRIAGVLRGEGDARELQRPATIQDEVVKTLLHMFANLLEVAGSKMTMKIVVAGAVSGILGGIGWPSVAVYSLTLAAWQGGEAFERAIASVFKSLSQRDAQTR